MDRATKAEMEERYRVIAEEVLSGGPMSVRHAYYRAVVRGVVPKTQNGYNKVQRACLILRQRGDIPYDKITDGSRSHFMATVYDSTEDALRATARFYRRNLWTDKRLEVWCESDSIAGTIMSVTQEWAVPLFPTRGQSSVTFAYEASHTPADVVLYVGDHDPAGLEIEASLRHHLRSFGVDPIWQRVGVTWGQVEEYGLPGTPPKKSYGYDLAVEAEALEADILRDLLDQSIESHADMQQIELLREVEQSEREILLSLAS